MATLWVLLLVVPFFIPIHFYPVPTYPEELIAALLLVSLATYITAVARTRICFNNLVVWWFAIGVIWLLSWMFNQKEVVTGAFFYQLFWVLGLIAIVVGGSLKSELGKEKLLFISAKTLVFAGFLYAAVGLFNYYGGLKFIIPWINSDQSRLVGVMGHPNLSGLYLSISLAAFGYFIYRRKHQLLEFRSIIFMLVVCLAGVLTGSRAFFVIVFVQLCLALLWVLDPRSRRDGDDEKRTVQGALKYQIVVIGISVSLFFVFPAVDESISKKLTDAGVLNRQSSAEMLVERVFQTGQPRLGEWRKIFEGTGVIDNVWYGVGPGSYAEFSVAADDVIKDPYRNGRTWRNAHNIFLMAFVEWGIIGAVFVLSFFVFLSVCFFKAERNAGNYFVWLALGSILVHNIVEFSLWYLQFLIVFLVLLGTQVKTISLNLTSPSLRWVVIVPVVLLTLWMGTTSSRDFFKMVYLFSKPDIGKEDVRTLDLIAQNSLWRPYSRMVMYFRLNPYASGIENQLREASVIAKWSPGNLVLMRQASLTAALGKEKLACERIARATELYPAIVSTLEEELVYLDSQGAPFDIQYMRSCFNNISRSQGLGDVEQNPHLPRAEP